MLLTLYYMYATLLQWWKIGVIRSKISKTLSNQSALILYQKNKPVDKKDSNIEDLLFSTEDKIGCTIVPKKTVSLKNWLPFSTYHFFPFSKNSSKINEPNIMVLIQADLKNFNNGCNYDQLKISDLGVPVAWTASDNFGIVLKTDLDKFSKLVSCFLANPIAINEGMEVLQVEMVDIDGEPRLGEGERISKKVKWPKMITSQKQWRHLIEDLKNICKKVNQICSAQNGNICSEILSQKSIETDLRLSPKSHLAVSKKENSSEHKYKSKSERDFDKHKSEKKYKKREKSIDTEEKKEKKVDKVEKEKKSDKKEKLEKVDKSEKSKSKRTKELSQDRMKQSSSMDRIKHKETPDKHKKDLHKSKREKFAKRHSDDRLLNKDIEIDTDIKPQKHKEKKEEEVNELIGKKRFMKAKPPNVLVCAESFETRENVKSVLRDILNRDKYIIYELASTGDPHFADNATLVIVCGNVPPTLTNQLLQYFLTGGHLLCLCSDFLNSVLHTFATAEVREHELVRFSYGEWRNVRMMHHIFCYQASPAKKHFSQDSDPNSSNQSSGNSPVAPRTPSTVEVYHNNKTYTVQVQVLGMEETWHTPSILLAKVRNGNGKAVFSQVHLEIDPTQYEADEAKCIALKESDKSRLEILKDILSNHLDVDCTNVEQPTIEYKPAYFLGRNDLKQEMLSELSGLMDNTLLLPKLTLQFCGKDIEPPTATEKLLPVLIHSCPNNFSTVEYFDNLQTEVIGRLALYVDMLTSSMDIVSGGKFTHGFVVIPKTQTSAIGRGGNVWLSPEGCAMFSVQLHIPMDSILATCLSLIQHLSVVSVVSAIRSLEGYEQLELGLKWPNDIYAYSNVKIGGVIVQSTLESQSSVCNIGLGFNLNNPQPTTCLNSIISKYNEENGTTLSPFSLEKYLAVTFNEMERILDVIQKGNLEYLFDLYYKYWLHSDSIVSVQTSEEVIKDVIITGIDKYGFLVVRDKNGRISSVQPDNNSFDMMQGLIAPKIR